MNLLRLFFDNFYIFFFKILNSEKNKFVLLSFFVISNFSSKIALLENSKFAKLSVGSFQGSLTGYQKEVFIYF